MLDAMSKPKKTAKPAASKPRGTVFNIRIGLEREDTLAEYLAAQDVAPDKTSVFLKAFDEFMARRGFPSKEKKGGKSEGVRGQQDQGGGARA
jgi:hypothetical protein